MRYLALVTLLALLSACETHWQGNYDLKIEIDLDTGATEPGTDIWLLDGSSETLNAPNQRGLKVCSLDQQGNCRARVEYGFHAARQSWQVWRESKSASEDLLIVIVDSGSIVGLLRLPDLSRSQVTGREALRLNGPIERIDDSSKSRIEKDLSHLPMWEY